jgi:hypothetical protein
MINPFPFDESIFKQLNENAKAGLAANKAQEDDQSETGPVSAKEEVEDQNDASSK